MAEKKDAQHLSKLAEELVGDLRGLASNPEPRHNLAGRSARPKDRVTQPLAAVVEQLLQEHRIGRSAPEDAIREQWPKLVGPAAAQYSHPLEIDRNRLIILTSHGVIRNELFLHKEEIVARVQKLPGCAGVKSLHLRNG